MGNTILVVDDNELNLDVLVSHLKMYDVITAIDGISALEIVEKEQIDLILLDIMMPTLDGFEVCSILKKSLQHSAIPIIFLSAKNSFGDINRGFELGAVDYITKPFNPLELKSRVKTHLELYNLQRSLKNQVTKEIEKNKVKENLLYQQSKQAALGELLMHISHQWKQPLSELGAINTLVTLKIAQGIPMTESEYVEAFNKTEKLIGFMSSTIETFQNFYKPSDARQIFFLTEAINNVLSMIGATLFFDNIKVEIDTQETIGVAANINEISQVVFALLNNAREIFIRRQVIDPQITIEVGDCEFAISDNGGGIDEEIIDDIFEPFISTNGSSGIGLYLSKSIIEKNGGTITATNGDKGAIFKVVF